MPVSQLGDVHALDVHHANLGWALEKKVLEIEMADLEAAIIAQEKYGARLLAESDDLA